MTQIYRRVLYDFFQSRLKYDVIRRIIGMTLCHPYLVQLVCSAIVEEANEIRVKLADMAILKKAVSRALVQGEPYFRNVWDEMAGKDGQEILRQIAQSDTPLAFSQPEYQKALVRMVKLKVLTKHDTGTYSVEVPIVRRWIREFAPI